ncbi:MAG: archaeosortase/exosortase family protein [Thermosphaera aggregans]|uniref:archaeosortase/exosortase family protein n=1 Tax=Thermosphaera aggregans TaxID=54254 RepID=UPI003C013154
MIIYEERLRYRKNLSAGFSLVMLILSYFLTTLYRDYLSGITKLMLVEEYSYLIPVVLSVTVTLYLSLRQVGFSYGIRLSKTLLSSCFLTLSFIFYWMSMFNLEFKIQYLGLSFSWLFLALVILVYEPQRFVDLIPLLTVFLLIPVPTSVIDALTPQLSRVVGRVAALLTGAVYVEKPGFSQIIVESGSGEVAFSVETVCTGIVTLSNIFSVFPILLFLPIASLGTVKKKMLASIASLITALVIGFAGNLVRVVLVILGVKLMGPDIGLTLFHYSPSIIYSSISIIVAILLIKRFLGGSILSVSRLHAITPESPRLMITSLFLTLLVSTIFIGTVLAVHRGLEEAQPRGLKLELEDLEEFLNHPSRHLLNSSDVTVLSERYDEFLTRVLGALKVYRVVFSQNNRITYTGYVEIVDTPARLHTWQLCLTLQGFKILNTWIKTALVNPVTFIKIEKDGAEYLLSYIIEEIEVISSNMNTRLYTRISILTPLSRFNPTTVEEEAANLLTRFAASKENLYPHGLARLIYSGGVAFYITFGVLIIYFLIIASPLIVRRVGGKHVR